MPHSSWVKTLHDCRQRPALCQGWSPTAHIDQGIHAPLQLIWEKQAFDTAQQAKLVVSPHQFHCVCETGPLLMSIEELIDWEEWDVLLQAFHEIHRQLHKVSLDWVDRFCEPLFLFGAFSSLLILAERGVVGIRTSNGLRCQTYERGWPKTPPFVVQPDASPVGLLIAASLSPEWCPGLPFTMEDVKQAIPEAARPFVTVTWRSQDDVVPECTVDPNCVLHAETVVRWL